MEPGEERGKLPGERFLGRYRIKIEGSWSDLFVETGGVDQLDGEDAQREEKLEAREGRNMHYAAAGYYDASIM
ncbi:hypothetical protein FQN55_004523 [Onygenales sp. PD_40]|nr:hypothetical protein FQN55_004523 [Onygenales sp. PD_40]KAK2775798.1 hypothetical protein FQN52_003877 [Onygenales sp. PD_12]